MKALNIISFDVPYPANYGGVIDVFYKLKSLSELGVQVHLHCFEYGRGNQIELEKYCSSVTYYKRKTGAKSLLSNLPYIVKSRENQTLKMNLMSNAHPILFEGLHCCYLLNDESLEDRIKLVRTHNIEHEYYLQLAENEKSPFKKHFFKTEAKKLKKFEQILSHANHLITISQADQGYFSGKFGNSNSVLIPAFHPSSEVKSKTGNGDYVLYHGNLSVAENAQGAAYLINNIFSKATTPFVVAGLNPPSWLVDLIEKFNHISLIKNPSDQALHQLISEAQINYLYTNQNTGLKLKLLNALFNGKHCLVNSTMVAGNSLGNCCYIADEESAAIALVSDLMEKEFTTHEIEKRKFGLNEFNNSTNAKQLSNLI